MCAGVGVPAVGNIGGLVVEDDAVNQSGAVAVEKADLFAACVEFEVRMQPGIGGIVVCPY